MKYTDQPLEKQPFSSKDELKRVIYDFNNTAKDYDTLITLHELFERQVERSSDKIAVLSLNRRLTYRELNLQANHIAKRLRDAGIKRNDIVGLLVNRSTDMLVGIMGILKAGGCYLPIDPSYPESRITYMLADSKAKLVLTQEQLRANSTFNGQTLTFDEEATSTTNCLNIENINTSSDLAYVIYTSGSTGKPKGVMLEHRAVHNFILGMRNLINFSSDKSIVCLTTISFDIFVLESILPLLSGMKILIADPMQLSSYLAQETVDMMQTTPSTMQLMLNDTSNHNYIRGLSEIMLGGEALPKRLLQELRNVTTAKIYNMYGPTETTVWSSIKDLSNSDEITIGKPIINTQMYIVDELNNPAGIGLTGELCIAGDGLARGYLNRESLTKEKFIQNPFLQGTKMYKTGDIARWLPNGEIELAGRKDNQVKIRGFRVEPGEIEACLGKLEEIQECAVTVKKNAMEEQYLVAYYVADKELPVSTLITFLRKSLPEFMLPGFYIRLARMPLTLNYKIDRNALPDPDTSRPLLDTEYLAPETQIEKHLTDIWRKILNRDPIGIHDNFFDLGGNSVLVSQIYVEMEKYYPGCAKITDIFSYSSISALANFISQRSTATGPQRSLQALTFPDTFLSENSGYASELVCSSTINSAVYAKLEPLVLTNDVSLKSLFLSAYMSLLSEITGTEELCVLFAAEDHLSYRGVRLDFAKTVDLIQLCKVVDQQSNDGVQERLYTADELQQMICEKGSYILTFYFEQANAREKKSDHELALDIHRGTSGLQAQISSKSGYLRKKSFEDVIVSYVNLLDAIAEAYEEEEK